MTTNKEDNGFFVIHNTYYVQLFMFYAFIL